VNDPVSNQRAAPGTGATAGKPIPAASLRGRKDRFLRLMLFHDRGWVGDEPDKGSPDRATGDFAALRHSMAKRGVRYTLPLPRSAAAVRLDSPANEVMTDLRRIAAATIDGDTSIDTANGAMIARSVRALFVTGEARQVHGIITSTDIQGEKPIQFAQERGIRHGDVLVRDIMTPADRLEILDFRDVERARVGDVVATLRLAGRQHALVVEQTAETPPGQANVRGIFSLTQIARQLGIPSQQVHDIANTFAEIEAVIGS
jgi:CBS domain-containing protein